MFALIVRAVDRGPLPTGSSTVLLHWYRISLKLHAGRFNLFPSL